MNTAFIKYALEEISQHKEKPYYMNNEKLADEIFPYIKSEFPDAQILKYDNSQWILVSKRSKTALIKRLVIDKEKYNRTLVRIEQVLTELHQIEFAELPLSEKSRKIKHKVR